MALCLAGLTLAAPATVAQQKLALTRPAAEYPEPFTNLRSINEMTDGRILAADISDKTLQLIDLVKGTAIKIGREGQGPEEYALPAFLFPMPDGGALLQDLGNRRFLPIGADGRIGKPVSLPSAPAPTSAEGSGRRFQFTGGGLIDARSSDSRGNLYFQGLALSLDAETRPDSVPLMRWNPSRTEVDTVGWLPVTEGMRPRVQRGSGNNMSVRIGDGSAWPKQTQWATAPDGRIALVTPEPYRVTWLTGSNRTVGPVIAVTPIKVTDAEKKAYVERMSRARPVVMTFGGGRSGAAPRIPPRRLEDIQFPEEMPPFSGRDAVLMTPEGEVWVSRLRSARDNTPRYDVFDGQGNRVGEVTLRADSRVIGFGQASVYVARSDEDDLQYLERYGRPARLGQ